jgi:hypothetical protein
MPTLRVFASTPGVGAHDAVVTTFGAGVGAACALAKAVMVTAALRPPTTRYAERRLRICDPAM